jgi:hypothetical protein
MVYGLSRCPWCFRRTTPTGVRAMGLRFWVYDWGFRAEASRFWVYGWGFRTVALDLSVDPVPLVSGWRFWVYGLSVNTHYQSTPTAFVYNASQIPVALDFPVDLVPLVSGWRFWVYGLGFRAVVRVKVLGWWCYGLWLMVCESWFMVRV